MPQRQTLKQGFHKLQEIIVLVNPNTLVHQIGRSGQNGLPVSLL